MKINRYIIAFVAAVSWLLTFSSCNDNDGDRLRGLGSRVEFLEDEVAKFNRLIQEQNEALAEIQVMIDENGVITNIVENADGSYTVTFSDGRTITLRDGENGKDGKDGKDGQEATLIVTVRQDLDGQWYWVLNGQWLLDSNGNKVPAGATDGADGKNGRNGHDGVPPQMRINEDGIWEVSTDGGKTWISTGVQANGKDGKDGRVDIFGSVVLSEDGTYLIITLADGSETFTIPIIV